ncbi:SusD/RagB family nutrient-binding outer membrane lipoprotein [Adhaeribacter arboris]|uniref:SusD/RagB family nutrient-binding outer membrane lipoprotein n=1 Tax=Adhaeribacter arboris TaxID=2072846 RepID=A0A2T2YBF7_9BACT|nr:SusD/RagB family nutrient-binding outer membrane lipoprotein [Adhaeribacter arboris]PSR52861.1 SusD/RagB family nutrient-binding outer membrane lipoprotein [Adhaeribacter arboris]
MKKTFIYIALASVLLAPACSEDHLDEVNTNPNAANASQFNPNFLLTDAQLSFSNTGYAQLLYQATGIQALASTYNYYGNGDKYVNAGNFTDYQGRIFNDGYTALSRLQQAELIANTQDPTRFKNVIAISNIMRVLIFQRITDTYGDVPYTEALKAAEGITAPKYDKQQAIYSDLLPKLEAAINSLDAAAPKATGDILYAGDVAQWKKFGYSLMVRLAMRLTKVDPATAQSWTEKAAAGGTLASYTDNALVKTDAANGDTQNSTTGALLTPDDFREVRWSKTLIDFLRAQNDPRLGVIGEIPQPGAVNNANQSLTGNTSAAVQVGMPNGYDLSGGAFDIRKHPQYPGGTGTGTDMAPLGNYSRPRVNVYMKRNAPNFILTYAQTEFLLAEAASRGWNVGASAAQHFANGLRGALQSLSQIDAAAAIDEASLAAYVTANPLSPANPQKQINEQYWAETATTFNFIEGWFNWRRSGYPELVPVNYPGNVTNATIPRRMIYPASEISNNPSGLQSGIASLQGGDLLTSRVWWDK